MRMYPDAPSKVVHAHHATVWDRDALVPQAIRRMLDTSITELTGLDDATEAWAALFDPAERIAIKVNAISGRVWTHVPLVMAVTECLQEVGVPAEHIVIFDRLTVELEDRGYPVNRDSPGVRCYGSETEYSAGWAIMDIPVQLSDILLDSDALINMPVLKRHSLSGITFAMKNHYGSFDRPGTFHAGIERAIAELNGLQPIRERSRLIIGDALMVNSSEGVTGGSIFMSFDPVAHDMAGLQLYSEVATSEGHNPQGATNLANGWLENAANLGLGTDNPDDIELAEVALG